MMPTEHANRRSAYLAQGAVPNETHAAPRGVWDLIHSDIAAWGAHWDLPRDPDGSIKQSAALRLIFNQPGLRATILFRWSHALWRSKVPALPGMLCGLNVSLHGLDIPAAVEAGPGLYIPHPVGTTVMAKKLGGNLTLVSGVTIGMRGPGEFPTVGDDVYVGAGARILGPIRIGSGARIGANAVVVKDVPEDATAIGVPARILPSKGASLVENERSANEIPR